MLFRSLIVLLTLAGSMPLRVCTCGADHAHAAAPGEDPPEPADDGDSAHAPRGHHHDHDCLAAHPRPPVRNVTPPPVFDVPADCAPSGVVTAEVPSFATELAPTRPDPADPPRVPLYLAFLSLRN
jgi:hypothetical protein